MFGKTFKILLLWVGVGQAIWGIALGGWFWTLTGISTAGVGLTALVGGRNEERRSLEYA